MYTCMAIIRAFPTACRREAKAGCPFRSETSRTESFLGCARMSTQEGSALREGFGGTREYHIALIPEAQPL